MRNCMKIDCTARASGRLCFYIPAVGHPARKERSIAVRADVFMCEEHFNSDVKGRMSDWLTVTIIDTVLSATRAQNKADPDFNRAWAELERYQ